MVRSLLLAVVVITAAGCSGSSGAGGGSASGGGAAGGGAAGGGTAGGGAAGGGTAGGGAAGGGAAGGGSAGGGSAGGGSAGGGSAGGGSAGGGSSVGPFMGHIEQLAPAFFGNESVDLAVDSQLRLHVVANDVGTADAGLFYGVRETDGGWVVTRVLSQTVSVAGVGTGAKILVGTDDRPRIAFTNQDVADSTSRARLFFGAPNGAGGFTIEEVEDAGFQAGVRFGFALDRANNPHVAYRLRNLQLPDGGPSQTIMYASRNDAGSWSREVLEQYGSSLGFNFAVTFALDSQDGPHVFYVGLSDAGTNVYKHAGKSGGQWLQETVTTGSPVGAAAAAQPNGDLVLAYDGVVAVKRGATWSLMSNSGAPNMPVAKTAPDGTTWILSNGGSTPGYPLGIARVANGVLAINGNDGGLNDARFHGFGFGGGEAWGASMRPTSTPPGIWIYRLR